MGQDYVNDIHDLNEITIKEIRFSTQKLNLITSTPQAYTVIQLLPICFTDMLQTDLNGLWIVLFLDCQLTVFGVHLHSQLISVFESKSTFGVIHMTVATWVDETVRWNSKKTMIGVGF